MTVREQVDLISDRHDFVSFVRVLRSNYGNDPTQWENDDVCSFLDALAAWADDLDGYFANRGEPTPEQPSWKLLGEMLAAARVYE